MSMTGPALERIDPQLARAADGTDPRGILVFEWLSDDLQNAEDSTTDADFRNRHWRSSVVRIRPSTTTERTLLAHLGFDAPDDLETKVIWLSDGVRRREWPALEGQTP
jgi:hypothetical protein